MLLNSFDEVSECKDAYHEMFLCVCLNAVLKAMVKFENPPRNRLVLVECRAYAQNIEHDITAKLGLVNFELLVEDTEPTAPVESR